MAELLNASRDAGFDGADGDVEDFGDVLVRAVFEVEQGQGSLVSVIHFGKGRKDLGAVGTVRATRRDRRQAFGKGVEFIVCKDALLASRLEKSPAQRGEQPGFAFGLVAELMAFGGPDVEGVLGEIASVGFRASQTHSKAEESFVVGGYEGFKLFGCMVRVHSSFLSKWSKILERFFHARRGGTMGRRKGLGKG